MIKYNKQLSLLFIIVAFALLLGYFLAFSSNVKEDSRLVVPSSINHQEIIASVSPYLQNTTSFRVMLTLVSTFKTIKSGSYKLEKGMNNLAILRIIVIGRQSPVKLTFNNQDTLEKLAGRVASELEFDSISLLNELKNNKLLLANNFTNETALAVFIPNSYEFYWNTTPEKFIAKMVSEYQNFWNTNRLDRAKKMGLSPIEVQILASIVQKETQTVSERPMVAALYLNRLKSNWPLQADPTIVFALKKQSQKDTVIKRVYKNHLLIKSPYNTYQNIGLPPGLISMPDISSIDAVLNAPKHDYYYMCASSENIGTHVFAKTLPEHNRNAIKYQKWLNNQGILR